MESITDEQISKAIKFLRDKNEQKNSLFAGVQRVNLQFCLFKLPVVPSSINNRKQVRVVMPHPLPNLDICLIVADGENRGDRTKIDETIHFYEELLRKAGITEIKEIIPLLKMKLEYQTFESKFALATRYNTLLADASICRFLPAILGKAFYGNKRIPIQVDLHEAGLDQRLRRTLHTQVCQMSLKGASNSVIVGQSEMTDEELVDNVKAAIAKIAESVPGGKDNIFKFSLRIHDSELIPIYISDTDRSVVPIPPLPEHFQTKEETLEDEVSTVKGKVTITPDGSVIVTKLDGRKDVIGAVKSKAVPRVNVQAMKSLRRRKRGAGKDTTQSNISDFPRVSSRIKKRSKMMKKPKSDSDKKKSPPTTSQESSEVNTATTALPATISKPKLNKSKSAEAAKSPQSVATPNKSKMKKSLDAVPKLVEQSPTDPKPSATAKKRKLESPSTPAHLSAKKSPKSKTPASQTTSPAAAKTPAKLSKTPGKTPAIKTPAVKTAAMKTPTANITAGKTTPDTTPVVKKTPGKTAVKTPAGKTSGKTPVVKTPVAKKTPGKTHALKTPAVKTPAKVSTPKNKTLMKDDVSVIKTPATESIKNVKTSSKKSADGVKTPARDRTNIVKTPKKMSYSPVKAQSNNKVKPSKTPLKSPKSGKKVKPMLTN